MSVRAFPETVSRDGSDLITSLFLRSDCYSLDRQLGGGGTVESDVYLEEVYHWGCIFEEHILALTFPVCLSVVCLCFLAALW